MKEDSPAYYAIIPANVRYDKNLKANEKLLYGEITALCNLKGYCWSKNLYFANLYSVSKNTISIWINDLKKYGYIDVNMIYKDGTKEIEDRYIRINGEGITKNSVTPITKNGEVNTTVVNNTINNTYTKEIENLWSLYPNKKGKAAAIKSIPKLLKAMEYEELKRCIERYAKENKKTEIKYLQYGSTFFNGGYMDYKDTVKDVNEIIKPKMVIEVKPYE